MESNLVTNLEHIVSAPRLDRYRKAARTDLETVVLYCWNIQLAEALMAPLALFEVTLRNAVHRTLTSHMGADGDPEFWFKSILHQRMYDNITDLMSRITRKQGVPPTAAKVISETTFGFWPLLFARRYNSLWWSPSDPLIGLVLPNYPKVARDTRSKLETRLEYFSVLRNRAMHHEAIFQGVSAINRPVVPIHILHQQLIETLGWLSQEAMSLASVIDHFDDTFRNGQSRIEAQLRSLHGT